MNLPICDYEDSQYQSQFWDQGERVYEDQVEAIALQRLLPPRGDLLLELGAGAGRNTPRYQNFKRIVLVDYSTSQLQQARAHLGDSNRYIYAAANIYHLPFVPGLFDAATLIRVLHHMADAPYALRGIRQVLKPGGIFILEFANKQNLKAILRYIFRRQSWNPFSREPVEFARLNFDFHPAAVRSWLQRSGFNVQRQLTVSHFRIDFLKRSLPLKLLVTLDSLAQWSGDLCQLSPSVFVRTQAVGDTTKAAAGQFFRCPACGNSPLEASSASLDCSACGRQWPIQDGIHDFRVT
ncbi:MAG: class I SAM-dependent methyltransferase [Anaerolineales bacterium]|nr:class I SAM-dependent methyltransferase [Anaerolineales bacterium]